MRRIGSLLLVVSAIACEVSKDVQPTATVDRGPTVIDVEGDPNGLFWDGDKTLYIADDDGNRILKYIEGAGVSLAAALPAAPGDGAGLGQVVIDAEGTLVVTRFGGGTTGDVVFARADGTSGVVPGLDPVRRRIGLTITDDGTMYVGFFIVTGDTKLGSIARLDLVDGETEVMSALEKPVGVLAVGDALYIADQTRDEIVKSTLPDLTDRVSVARNLESADLLCAGPDGSLFTGGKGGSVYRITAAGLALVFSSGFQEVRGTAYDAVNRRLFLVDHDGDESDGTTHKLHILPVDLPADG